MAETIRLTVSDFIAVTNQTLEVAYPSVEVVGEVQGFKLNQNKYVFFDLKDETASVGCFMMAWQLRTPLEDGMQVVVTATPKLTNWGKFSLTVRTIQLVGEGSLKRSSELLKAKLTKEGLFEPSRKRSLPFLPAHIGVVSSTQAAGYADFIKILGQRWGGMKLEVAQVQVQGSGAADQIIRALTYFNEQSEPPEVVVIVRGGGSLDDLSTFNDEVLTRAVATSRIPILTGIGHETDQSLVDLAADVAAATPSNAAQVLVLDRREIKAQAEGELKHILRTISERRAAISEQLRYSHDKAQELLAERIKDTSQQLSYLRQLVSQLNPEVALRRGYAIVRSLNGQLAGISTKPGEELSIELKDAIITAGVQHVRPKKTN